MGSRGTEGSPEIGGKNLRDSWPAGEETFRLGPARVPIDVLASISKAWWNVSLWPWSRLVRNEPFNRFFRRDNAVARLFDDFARISKEIPIP